MEYSKALAKVETNNASLPAVRHDGDKDLAVTEKDIVRRYLDEINRYPLLTREEEQALTQKYYETHDPVIASRIVTANLRLVVKIAMDFQKLWMQNFLDLVQEGSIGLMQAVKNFDPYKGVKFSYYASFWIKAYILKFIMDNWRLVKIGTTQAQRKLFYNLNKEKDRLNALGFEPVPKLISEKLNVSEKEVIEMEKRLGSAEVSLDTPLTLDSDENKLDFLPSNDMPMEISFARTELSGNLGGLIDEFASTLDFKEKIIFEKRLMTDEPLKLQELGEQFGVSRERIRQLETRLKGKLRIFLKKNIKDIDSYVELLEEL